MLGLLAVVLLGQQSEPPPSHAQDVHVDAGTPVAQSLPPPPSPGAKVFASLEQGAGIESADGRFSTSLHLITQPRLSFRSQGSFQQAQLRVPMARVQLKGTVFSPRLKYFVQAELAGTFSLLDLEAIFEVTPTLLVHGGQFVTPFSREFVVPPFKLLFPDYAPSNVAFRDGRQRGVYVEGRTADSFFTWAVALTGHTGITSQTSNPERPMASARAVVTPWGSLAIDEVPSLKAGSKGLSIGANVSFMRAVRPVPGTGATGLASLTTVGLDVDVHSGAFDLAGEGYARLSWYSSSLSAWSAGGYLEASLFVVPQALQLAVRGDVLVPAAADLTTRRLQGEGLVAYYFAGHHLKAQLAWATAQNGASGGLAHELQLQTQLWF